MKYENNKPLHDMRAMCKCGSLKGTIEPRGGQDCMFCANCGKWQYNAPKVETGREVRSTQTVHEAIKPKTRAAVLLRSGGKCELCGKAASDCVIHVGHVVSVNIGLTSGMTDSEINDEENLIALCDECNLGLGDQPVPVRVLLRIVTARLKAKYQLEPVG